ncbi:purine nucleoside phosphorylase [Burkholderia lata]|uniref:Purine nucleoside phosphorylase n=1 Tax=Burkholderia lata (strain ATCC 17760 / DSM 23089 / LMG 22485 / NCIMB 9086 / R18194 / 383) TaxID=482957 RepID=A0A6P2L0Q5_BURL3|nr:DUF4148 domain-containing protein [Burkholderia lata]VWB60566.1 purine nucleoside phosphorylase [Burkholderia lata]
MKPLIRTIAVASVFAAPAFAFAQSSQPLTRAQVRQELIELEQAGYNPMDYYYAESLRAAEEKIARQRAAQGADATDFGGQQALARQ